MQAFSQRIGIAALLVSLIAIFLAFFLTSYATNPLRILTQRVRQMGGLENPVRSISLGVDETMQLEQAFDHLETELSSKIEALTNERGLLATVMESMTDGVVIVNQDGNVELINPAAERLFNTSLQQANGQSLIEVFRHHQLVEVWKECLQSGELQTTSFETSVNRLYIQAIAVSLHQSLHGSTLLVLQDLTRMRRLELVRRDFVSNVSHELRTPLASLKALTETLQEGALEDPPAARRFLLRMENEIDNLTQLVTELLELSRIESGKVPLKMRVVQPAELIERAFDRMEIQAERAGLKISRENNPSLPPIIIDRDRLEQVLVNLVHNAIKFTPPGGEIAIGAATGENRVEFFVRDTGVGISPEALPRIFERFYKADRSRSGGGTGLGLSIARHLVEAHGGRIWAESVPGKGSTFTFSIPLST
jgi:two-component system phosphate regulon sensor histidine kinase PhoR